jgi:hypothetical protein
VFPGKSESGHAEDVKLIRSEKKLFAFQWTAHTLRHSWISISENKVALPPAHSRLLTNHAVPKSGDAHKGYNHPDFKDLRKSQGIMSAFLKRATQPAPRRPKQPKRTGNVVQLPQIKRRA